MPTSSGHPCRNRVPLNGDKCHWHCHHQRTQPLDTTPQIRPSQRRVFHPPSISSFPSSPVSSFSSSPVPSSPIPFVPSSPTFSSSTFSYPSSPVSTSPFSSTDTSSGRFILDLIERWDENQPYINEIDMDNTFNLINNLYENPLCMRNLETIIKKYIDKTSTVIDICPCCIESETTLIKCGDTQHGTCESCITQWFNKGKTSCPICRANLISEDEIEV